MWLVFFFFVFNLMPYYYSVKDGCWIVWWWVISWSRSTWLFPTFFYFFLFNRWMLPGCHPIHPSKWGKSSINVVIYASWNYKITPMPDPSTMGESQVLGRGSFAKKKRFSFFSFFFLILFGTFCLMRESCVNVGQVEVGMRRLRDAHGTLFRLICRLSQILSCYM